MEQAQHRDLRDFNCGFASGSDLPLSLLLSLPLALLPFLCLKRQFGAIWGRGQSYLQDQKAACPEQAMLLLLKLRAAMPGASSEGQRLGTGSESLRDVEKGSEA